jgi:excisionase family DNA binding protein
MGNERQTYTIEQAAKIIGVSRNTGYDAAKSGQLPTIKVGRRLLVPRVALERMLATAAPAAA